MKTETIANHTLDAHDETVQWAEEVGLRYVHDHQPGITRHRVGRKGFQYRDHKGGKIVDAKILERIRDLVIPPAWEEVWICRFGNGHLQATGRDARNRKQYRYHEKWTLTRNENKFEKLKEFGQALPHLRAQVETDLRKPGLSREKVLAAVVKTMELTRIRIGNEIYAETNDSYGLTTFHNEHAKVTGADVKFKFRGKSGKEHEVKLHDPRLSRVIRQCQELPGEELFSYVDDEGEIHHIGSSDVNDYLKSASGVSVTAKDFRTWGGTVKAIEILLAGVGVDVDAKELSPPALKRRQVQVIRETAGHLGNTISVCRKYYVHPGVFDADLKGQLKKLKSSFRSSKSATALSVEEKILLELL